MLLKHFRVFVKMKNDMPYDLKSEFTGSTRNPNLNILEIVDNSETVEPWTTL